VNHATGTFDMRKMGGLSRYMPVTFWTTTIAGLSLVGVFPLAGFWSKDEILADAWVDQPLLFWAGLAVVFLTALYVGRMLILTFGGEYKGGEPSEHAPSTLRHGSGQAGSGRADEPQESPWIMLLPMVVLAAMSVTAGFVNIGDGLGHLLEGSLSEDTLALATESGFEFGIAAGSVAVGLAGLGVAWLVYGARAVRSEDIREALQPLPEVLENKYYLDSLYEDVIVRNGVLRGVAFGLDLWDRYVVDGVVNGAAALVRESGERLRLAQAGQAQLYGTAIFIGLVAAIAGILLVNP
jgi:NADH-quinone oxidoreductase subunit L